MKITGSWGCTDNQTAMSIIAWDNSFIRWKTETGSRKFSSTISKVKNRWKPAKKEIK